MTSFKLKMKCFMYIVVVDLLLVVNANARMLGGRSQPKAADEIVNKIVEGVWKEVGKKIMTKTNESFKPEYFTVISYETQLVNGINYFIKVKVNADKYVHLRVFKAFAKNSKPELVKMQLNKTKNDPIEYF